MEPRKNELYFEEIGKRFGEWMSDYDVQQRVKLLLAWLPQKSGEMSCLEVGCGNGRISRSLFPRVGRLTVCDLSEKLSRETGLSLGIEWNQQDACHLKIADHSYDLVISSECIEHTPDPCRAIAEMARVLKKDGVLILTTPNRLWKPVLWMSEVLKFRKFAGNEEWLFPWKAAQVMRENGLKNLKVGGCHLFPWQIPFAKKVLPWLDRFGDILYPLMINFGIRGEKRSP